MRPNPGGLRSICLLAAVFLLAGALAGCGSPHGARSDQANAGSSGSAAATSMANGAASGHAAYDAEYLASVEAASGDSANTAGMTAGTSSAFQPAERKIIYSADVVMEVEDFDKAQAELANLIGRSGGYMLHFNDRRTVREIGGDFTIKVPADGFQSFLEQLETLKKGNEFRRSVRGEDVTEEYVDLSARLRAKEAAEKRLLQLMEQATEAKDLLELSNELARVQEEIESYKGRIRYINENVAYSTVNLHMYEVIDDGIRRPGDDSLLSRMGESLVDSTKAVIRFLGDAVVFLAGALPVLVLLAAVGVPVWLVVRRLLRTKRERALRAGGNGPGLADHYQRTLPPPPSDRRDNRPDVQKKAPASGAKNASPPEPDSGEKPENPPAADPGKDRTKP